jgi:hypothetical protein
MFNTYDLIKPFFTFDVFLENLKGLFDKAVEVKKQLEKNGEPYEEIIPMLYQYLYSMNRAREMYPITLLTLIRAVVDGVEAFPENMMIPTTCYYCSQVKDGMTFMPTAYGNIEIAAELEEPDCFTTYRLIRPHGKWQLVVNEPNLSKV